MTDVSTKTSSITAMEPDWDLARALLGGTRAMREAGMALLPKWPNEEQAAYDCRLATAVLFPAYKRTVATLTGKPFSKPLTLSDDTPPEIREWAADIDLQGRNLDAFGADMLENAGLGFGLGGILVEYPVKDPEVKTVADERKAGLRPYFVEIRAGQLRGWRAERAAGAWRLTQLRFMECVEEPDGSYGTKNIDQMRVLEPGRWETHRQNDKKEWVLFEQGVTSLPSVPFVPVYGERIGFMMGKPPLVELAHMNVKHWQSQSDQDTILHVARVPILAVTGIDDENWTMTVGSSAAVRLPTNADMKYVEHGGAAIGAGKISLDDLKEEMRQAGAELLVIKPGSITATQENNENAVGMCALQRIAQGLEDSLDQALQIMADWVGLETGGNVTLFNDYAAATMAEASQTVLNGMNLSDETKFEEAQRRNLISPDRTWEEERDRLDAQGPPPGTMTGAGDGNGQ